MAWCFSSEYIDSDLGSYVSPDVKPLPGERERFEAVGKSLLAELKETWKSGAMDFDTPEMPYIHQSYPFLLHGWRWPKPERPFVDCFVQEQEDEIVDWNRTSYDTWAISAKVIDIIESVEPNIHQYIDYEMRQPDGSAHPAKRWLLNICTRAEVVDVERSNTEWVKDLKLTRKFFDYPDRMLIMSKREIFGRAMRHEWRYMGNPNTFFSDAFVDALKAAGIKGWQPHFSCPHHMEEL